MTPLQVSPSRTTAAVTTPDTEPPRQSPRVQPGPVRRPAAAVRAVSIISALALVAAGVAAGQEALATLSALGLRPEDGWVRAALEQTDGVALDRPPVVVGAAAVAALGLLVLVTAWHVGPRTARLRGAPSVELRAADVARLASAAAEDVDGVLSAVSTASLRTVVVRVRTTDASQVGPEVEEVVGGRLAELDPAPRVRVRATTDGGDTP